MKKHEISLDQTTISLDRFFQYGISSCHAYLTLREDFRNHVRRVQRDICFHGIRFHGIFDDEVGVVHYAPCRFTDPDGGPLLNFQNIIRIYRFFVEQGMTPFVELGFMPEQLASGTKTCFAYKGNVTPPKDYIQWGRLVKRFAAQMVETFGLDEVRRWHFEVWNEPDLSYFWTGSQADYFRLYAESAKAIKSVDAELKVGGPATSGCKWIRETLDFCKGERLPLDFISTHHYCTESGLGIDGQTKETRWGGGPQRMYDSVAGVHKAVDSSAFPKAEVHFTEWNATPVHGDRFGKDSEFTAAFVLGTLKKVSGLVDSYMFWTVSDIFEESGLSIKPFTGKYGIVNFDGVPKPVFHAFRWMAMLYDEEITGTPDWCRVTRGPKGELRVLAWNLPEVEKMDLTGEWTLKAIPRKENLLLKPLRGRFKVVAHGVDEKRGNAMRAWQKMGSPAYPTPEQVAKLHTAAEATFISETTIEADGEGLALPLDLPPCGALFCDISPA
jgi:xylan 1,4-beta-xylosidase